MVDFEDCCELMHFMEQSFNIPSTATVDSTSVFLRENLSDHREFKTRENSGSGRLLVD